MYVRIALGVFGLAAIALGLGLGVVVSSAAPSSAAAAVATKLQLRGHLPELGERSSLRLFLTADAYDTYHRSLGDADVFPPSGSLFTSFDREILALYARGNDTGGRCLRTLDTAGVAGDTITIGLAWQDGTCGAPPSAHYPFILVSLSRLADDRSAWIAPGRQVCASAPGADGSRACAPVASSAASASPSAPASPTSASPAATVAPTRSPAPAALASPSAPPSPEGGSDLVGTVGLIAIGVVAGAIVVVIALSSRRVHRP